MPNVNLITYRKSYFHPMYVFQSLKAVVLSPPTVLVPTTQNVVMEVVVCSASVRAGTMLPLIQLPVNEVCYLCGLNLIKNFGLLKQFNSV